MAYNGPSFQIIGGKGQSPFEAALQHLAGYTQNTLVPQYNQRSRDAIATFQNDTQDLYGDAYKQKLAEFANDPANRNAMHRFGNQLSQEKTEDPAAQLKRLQAEYQIGSIQKGADPNAGWQAQLERLRALGVPITKPVVEQLIAADPNLSDQERQAWRIKTGIEQSANNAGTNASRERIAKLTNETRLDIAEIVALERQRDRSQRKEFFDATIAERVRQFNEKKKAAVAAFHPLHRMQAGKILDEIAKINADLIKLDDEINMGVLNEEDGTYSAHTRGGETQKNLHMKRSAAQAQLARYEAQLAQMAEQTGAQGGSYTDGLFGGY